MQDNLMRECGCPVCEIIVEGIHAHAADSEWRDVETLSTIIDYDGVNGILVFIGKLADLAQTERLCARISTLIA